MSRDYIAKSRKAKGNIGRGDKDFNANVACCSILGEVAKTIGETADYGKWKSAISRDDPPWKADEAQAKRMATKLRGLTDAQINALFKELSNLIEPQEPATLKAFIDEWATWLETCGGYTTLG